MESTASARLDQAEERLQPLILDLDHTVINTDLLYESVVVFLRREPWQFYKLGLWLMKGKAHLKEQLSRRVELDIEHLPLNDDLITYARWEAENGRPIHLATASHESIAHRIAERLDFIDEVHASTGTVNLKSATKAAHLKERFPEGFQYAGDSMADVPVFAAASQAILVHPSERMERAAKATADVKTVFPREKPTLKFGVKVLRLHQWAKNALLFVPLILGGLSLDPTAWMAAFAGFIALGMMASATYLINDLWDLDADRAHWSKKFRPLASGRLGITTALGLIPLGIGGSLALGAAIGGDVVLALLVYLAATLTYSLYLKRVPFLDTAMLASLFTLRLGLGVVLVDVPPSPWLFVFSMFLFLSLSLAKRYTEVIRNGHKGKSKTIHGRGYTEGDDPVLMAFGSASGVAAVLVMVLYLTNEAFNATFYSMPVALWGLPVVLFLWLGRIWLMCQRQLLDDDPVVFAVKDRPSLALGGIMGLFFIFAWLGGQIG
ncbi:MAG: prenyltransferase [Hyphomicrobiales bacterium]|nr:MAG: prenyltransferase [Hyphomicrobiales bacterium]